MENIAEGWSLLKFISPLMDLGCKRLDYSGCWFLKSSCFFSNRSLP